MFISAAINKLSSSCSMVANSRHTSEPVNEVGVGGGGVGEIPKVLVLDGERVLFFLGCGRQSSKLLSLLTTYKNSLPYIIFVNLSKTDI